MVSKFEAFRPIVPFKMWWISVEASHRCQPLLSGRGQMQPKAATLDRCWRSAVHYRFESLAPRKRDLKGSKWAANEYVATWPDGVNDVQVRGEPRSSHGVRFTGNITIAQRPGQ